LTPASTNSGKFITPGGTRPEESVGEQQRGIHAEQAARYHPVQLPRLRQDHAPDHVLRNREGIRIAIIVNDMSEVSIDAERVRAGAPGVLRRDETSVEMTTGCICCTLRGDLLTEVRRLAVDGRFDYLLVESTGISEPLPVAATFGFRDAAGSASPTSPGSTRCWR
jgi:hypothetical protein